MVLRRTGRRGAAARRDLLPSTDAVRDFAPITVLTSSNAVPHFFPGVKTEVFHGFDAGKPRHIYIRGFFDLYCTTGPRDTRAFEAKARELGHFAVHETGWPKLDPFMRAHGANQPPPVRAKPAILYHSTFSPSWSAAPILYETIRDLSQTGRWQWIVTLHPKSERETVERYRALQGEHLRFATEDNILDLFPQVDMMISDTSSALNEFLLTYKPVITFKNRRPGPQPDRHRQARAAAAVDRARTGAAAGLDGRYSPVRGLDSSVSRRALQRARARCRRPVHRRGASNPRPGNRATGGAS